MSENIMESYAPSCAFCSSLGSKNGNIIQNTDEAKKNHARIHFAQSKMLDGEITEDEIFHRCFTNQQPNADGASMSQCQESLLNHFKTLLKDHSKNTVAVCNLCGAGISTKEKKHVVYHACAHLEIKLFQCRHCDRSSTTNDNVLKHIRRVHNILKPTREDFENKTVEHFDEISVQMKRCFSTKYPRASGLDRKFAINSHCRDKRQRSIVNLCHSLYIHRSSPLRVECNLCALRISVRQGNRSFSANSMFQHAAAHLEVKLFTCRYCDQAANTKATIRHHLKNSHMIVNGNTDDYDDQSEKFHCEHLDVIERCFSSDRVKQEISSAGGKSSIKAEAVIRSLTVGSRLTIARRLFCNRLIRKVVDRDGSTKCPLCSKRLAVMRSGRIASHVAFAHVETHLQKPLYRCKVCKSSHNTRESLIYHLKTRHALGLGKNYEYIGDEFHDDILSTVSKCYSAEGS